MEHINQDIDELVSYEAKKEILKGIGQKDLLNIFDDYKPKYKPITRKKSPLDQQISLGISKEEKDLIAKEVKSLKSGGEKVSISSLVRSRAVGDIDIQEWKERAERGLRELNSLKWDRPEIEKKLRQMYSQFDELPEDDDESQLVISKKIKTYEAMIGELTRPTVRRASRMSGRVTFNEANHIRWRAGRLTITVADYMRFLIFGHLPFSENDRHLSIEAKRRFYVSIIDIANNGWGDAPRVEECPNCARYAHENKELRSKLDRLRNMSR